MPSLNQVLAVILGGGRGTRLFPLTQVRSKPAVPIAGKYRLIDIPISNCINSDIFKIAVLTQFNSVSLHRHIANTYNFDVFHSGWVQIWAAEQTMQNADWYQGTADAVRKQLFEIRSTYTDYILILAGDHLYRMDYSEMIRNHWENKADISVAVQPIRTEDAGRFGLLKRNKNGQIVSFAEKPTEEEVLKDMVSRDDAERPYLGSMGIYLFNKEVLIEMLETTNYEDFGKHVIPYAFKKKNVIGFDFDGYWEDIGTIRSFYETNLALARRNSRFKLYDPQSPIYTHARFLPGSIIENSCLKNVLLGDGCYIEEAKICNAVIGTRGRIRQGSVIEDTIIMGADYYEKPNSGKPSDQVPLGVGENCSIKGAIIDKNPRIADHVTIEPFPRGTNIDSEGWVVRDGIVVIPKNSVLYSGTRIGPAK